ncbi:MAG: hypothetical protein U1E65_02450 [Myxococcota bacterium]
MLLLVAGLAGCGGSIEFGGDHAGLDGSVLPDAGSDAGAALPDSGVVADAGCRALTRPSPPVSWPFPMTAAAYQSHFWDQLPGNTTCGVVGCHAAGSNAPLIPAAAADLANATTLQTAISQLWMASAPSAVGGLALIRTKHDPAGMAQAPTFNPAQLAYVDMYLQKAYDCAWKTVTPMAGDCPIPSTAYCDQ